MKDRMTETIEDLKQDVRYIQIKCLAELSTNVYKGKMVPKDVLNTMSVLTDKLEEVNRWLDILNEKVNTDTDKVEF